MATIVIQGSTAVIVNDGLVVHSLNGITTYELAANFVISKIL